MNRLTVRLKQMKKIGEKALIPYITVGDPNLKTTAVLMKTLVAAGADVIELGIPFSDPLADGPVLQAAAQRALQNTVCLDDICFLLAQFREEESRIPVVLLVYYNIIYHAGVEAFCAKLSAAGADALVVPDLPYEECADLDAAAKKYGLINIRFLSPTTTGSRLQEICRSAEGFIYCVTVTGVTGERQETNPAILKLLSEAKTITDVPLALGFGISTPAQAAQAAQEADAVITGSALVKRIYEEKTMENKCRAAGEFVSKLKNAILIKMAEGANHVTAATD